MKFTANGDASDADANNWIKNYCSDLKKASAAKQVTVGALSGWCAGFVFTKFGKTASAAIGGTLILLHLAHYNGYIKVDWKRLNKDVELAKKELEKKKDKELPKLLEKVSQFIRENVILAGGFAGGFFLGLSSG